MVSMLRFERRSEPSKGPRLTKLATHRDMVHEVGLEPTRLEPTEFKSVMFTKFHHSCVYGGEGEIRTHSLIESGFTGRHGSPTPSLPHNGVEEEN